MEYPTYNSKGDLCNNVTGYTALTIHRKQISEDIKQLIIHQPFFASIILKQKLIITEAVPTAGVDGVHLVINPVWYLAHDPWERITILAHEALHLTNKHNVRRGNRDRKLWNVAGDMAINKHLTKSPFKLPAKGTYDDHNKYGDGACTEYIYACLLDDVTEKMLEDQQSEDQDDSQGQMESDDDSQTNDESGDGDQSDDGALPSEEEVTDPNVMPSDEDNQVPKQHPRDKAIDEIVKEHQDGQCGEVWDHPQLKDMPQESLETAQDIDTNIAMNQAKKRGKMPASIEESIKKSYEEKVDWRSVLSRWIEGLSDHDYNWLYPNDSHLQNDLVMPSLRSDGFGNIKIAIDTSGSMSNEELQVAVTEVFNGLRAYHDNGQSDITIELIYFDSVVQSVEKITSPSDVTKPVGRGGTSFSPVFEYIKVDPNPPMGLILITDGYCSVYSNDKPPCDVVWMLTCMSGKEFNPPFGDCVEVQVNHSYA